MRWLVNPSTVMFVGLFLFYLSGPVMPVSDSKWTTFEAVSLVRRGDIDLNEYGQWLEILKHHGTVSREGKVYDYFPPGMTVLAAGPVFVLSRIFSYGFLESHPFETELLIASALMAIAAACFFQAASRHLKPGLAALLTIVYALGTQACSTGSRALWQQSGLLFLIPIFLLLVQELSGASKRRLAAVGLVLGFSYVIRPTAAIWITVASLWVASRIRERALWVFVPGILIALLFAAFSLRTYGGLLPPYYSPDRVFQAGTFFEALAGNLVSPARGILIWSPIFIFALAAPLSAMRTVPFLLPGLVCAFLHWLVVSSFPDWWGGHSVGPRLMSETAPFLCYALIPFLQRPGENLFRLSLFCLAASVGMGFHVRSIFAADVIEWNRRPEINEHLGRLWDFRDPQPLAGSTGIRVFFKLRPAQTVDPQPQPQ